MPLTDCVYDNNKLLFGSALKVFVSSRKKDYFYIL